MKLSIKTQRSEREVKTLSIKNQVAHYKLRHIPSQSYSFRVIAKI